MGPESIQMDIKNFINITHDEVETDIDSFPLKNYHLLALELFQSMQFDNLNKQKAKFLDEFYFISYFISSDFQIKILNDIINKLALDNVEFADGHLLADKMQQMEPVELQRFVDIINKKCKLAQDFYNLTVKLTQTILNISNILFSSEFVTSLNDEFDQKLDDHLRIDRSNSVISILNLDEKSNSGFISTIILNF